MATLYYLTIRANQAFNVSAHRAHKQPINLCVAKEKHNMFVRYRDKLLSRISCCGNSLTLRIRAN